MPIVDFICECFTFAALIVMIGGSIIALLVHNYREWDKQNYEADFAELKRKRKLQREMAKKDDPLWWV